MNYKEFKQYVDKMNKGIADKLKDNEEELAFYIELVKRFNDICEENAELKSQLKGTTHCYDEEEHRQLKKQLEEMDRKLFFTKNELDMRQKSIDNKLNQQQEFIKYLEDMLDDDNDIFSVVRVKDVLQKYKEIIGETND